MVNKTLVAVGILVLVGLGLMFVTTMTGNVITGFAAVESIDVDEPFRISEFGAGEDEVVAGVEVDGKDGA